MQVESTLDVTFFSSFNFKSLIVLYHASTRLAMQEMNEKECHKAGKACHTA